LIVANLMLILSSRLTVIRSSVAPANRALAWLFVGAGLLLAAVWYLPPLRGLFHLTPPHADDLLYIATGGAAAFGLMLLVRTAVPLKQAPAEPVRI